MYFVLLGVNINFLLLRCLLLSCVKDITEIQVSLKKMQRLSAVSL
jgi:hypothetical protein